MKIPIPEALKLEKEIAADKEATVQEFVENGLSLSSAKEKAGDLFGFCPEDIRKMEWIQNTKIFLWAEKYKIELSQIELIASFLPTVGLTYFLHKEVPMFDLMYQGGIFSWVLVALGVLGVLMQLRLLFSWFVAKNHYEDSFKKSVKLPLKIGVVCFLFGILGTALGLFLVFSHMSHVPTENFRSLMVTGLKESMVNLVLGTAVLSIIYSLHTLIGELVRKGDLPVT